MVTPKQVTNARSSPRLELLHQFDSVWYNMVYGGNMVADANMQDIPLTLCTGQSTGNMLLPYSNC